MGRTSLCVPPRWHWLKTPDALWRRHIIIILNSSQTHVINTISRPFPWRVMRRGHIAQCSHYMFLKDPLGRGEWRCIPGDMCLHMSRDMCAALIGAIRTAASDVPHSSTRGNHKGEKSIGLPYSRSNTAPYSTYHSFVGPFCAAGT